MPSSRGPRAVGSAGPGSRTGVPTSGAVRSRTSATSASRVAPSSSRTRQALSRRAVNVSTAARASAAGSGWRRPVSTTPWGPSSRRAATGASSGVRGAGARSTEAHPAWDHRDVGALAGHVAGRESRSSGGERRRRGRPVLQRHQQPARDVDPPAQGPRDLGRHRVEPGRAGRGEQAAGDVAPAGVEQGLGSVGAQGVREVVCGASRETADLQRSPRGQLEG